MNTNRETSTSAFFPPLPDILSGSTRLISFEAALNALCIAPAAAADNPHLEKFCYDGLTFTLLASCPDALPQPSAKSKSDYEARTAPIQVSGSQNGDYDLEQMKKDALELSGQLGVDESLALRVVLLEWQSRAEEQLMTGSEDVSRAGDLGTSMLGRSLTSFGASVNGLAKPAIDFADEATRRRRQLEIYCKERSSRLKLGAGLLAHAQTHNKSPENKIWADDLASQLQNNRFTLETNDPPASAQIFAKCISALHEQIQMLDDPSRLPKIAQASEEMMLMYAAGTFNDIVSILRLLLVVCENTDTVTASPALSWFKELESVNYFLTLPPSRAWPDTTELHGLISLISFNILDASVAAAKLRGAASSNIGDVSYPRLGPAPYFEDAECVSKLNIIFYHAAANNISILSPAILAWSIVTCAIRDVAQSQTEMRDRMLDEGSSDNEIGQRRPSRRESRLEPSLHEELYTSLQSMELEPEVKDDTPTWFVRVAIQSVFGVVAQLSAAMSPIYSSGFESSLRQLTQTVLLEMLNTSIPIASYDGDVLEAILAVLTPPAVETPRDAEQSSRLCSDFINGETFRREILDQTLARYPFELSPLLRIVTALASAHNAVLDIMETLESLRTMTIQVPENFNAYTLENEDQDTNEIRIDQPLPLCVSRNAPSRAQQRAITMGGGQEPQPEPGANVTSIPAGTNATVLKESRPMVLKLQHPHSAFQYFAVLLSTCLPNSEMRVERSQPGVDLATAADIIAMINAFLSACLKGPQPEVVSKQFLGNLDDALPVERDFIFIVTELFECELVAHLDQTAQEGSLDLLIACAEFFALLVKVDSARVWSALARSSLLGLNGGTNALAAVVGTMETAMGQFRFLSACTSIYRNLVGDAIGGLIKRKATDQPVKRGRFDSPIDRNEYTPERTMQRVLSTYTGVMLEAWESLSEWRFAVMDEKSAIASMICSAFSLLITATYGLQQPEEAESQDKEKKEKKGERRLAGMLFPAADAVLVFFTSASGSASSLRSFTAAFAGAAAVFQASSSTADRLAQVKTLLPMIQLLATLLRTSRAEDKEGKRTYAVALQLLKATPHLVVIFTAEPSLKGEIAALLTEMVVSLNSTGEQNDPPSLLGQLSGPSAKAFLTVLSQLDRPICDVGIERQIWNFLSAVMRGRQQWLALYLLTGTVPKERLSASTTQKANGKSLLTYALTTLSPIEEVTPDRSIGLLSFISAAQGASIWANNEVRANGNFLKTITNWLQALKKDATRGNKEQELLRTKELRIAALVCEVLAQAVHTSMEVGDQAVLKLLKGKLTFLAGHGHAVDAYNRNIHKLFTDNFRSKFSGVDVATFRRSAANAVEGSDAVGQEGMYDIGILDLALQHEWAWFGSTDRGGKTSGFRDEAVRTDINFGLLQAQAGLLRSWSVLATALAESVATAEEGLKSELDKDLARGVMNALDANASADLDVPGTDKVMWMRAQMTFVVMSKLAPTAPTPELRAVLPAAHRALRASPADLDIATRDEDLHYYRLGLQTLVLAIQPHIHTAPEKDPSANGARKPTDETPLSFLAPVTTSVLSDIVTATVAPAWRALAGNLHTNIACAMPGDFALVVALLQAVLAVPGSSAAHTQMAEVVASFQLVRSALSLYSWSDRLTDSAGDPVYGELAMQFLRVLSTMKPVAEHIAVESALPQLGAANLSSYLRKPGGKGPFDEPRRMFGIWSEGMLPLCLNLLDAVGPPVAGEVSAFVNGFPLQLERANAALENREATKFEPHAGTITLGMVQEAHALCLISIILRSDAARAAAEGIELGGSLAFSTSVRPTAKKTDNDAKNVDVEGPLLGYDCRKVIAEAQGLLRAKASLAARIVAASPVEVAWGERRVDVVDSVLTRRVFAEVEGLAGLAEENGDE